MGFEPTYPVFPFDYMFGDLFMITVFKSLYVCLKQETLCLLDKL